MEWIDIGRSVPPLDEMVIVAYIDMKRDEYVITFASRHKEMDGCYWLDSDDNFLDEPIHYWLRLPELPNANSH